MLLGTREVTLMGEGFIKGFQEFLPLLGSEEGQLSTVTQDRKKLKEAFDVDTPGAERLVQTGESDVDLMERGMSVFNRLLTAAEKTLDLNDDDL